MDVIETYLERLNNNQQIIAHQVIHFLSTYHLQIKIKYNIPFFYQNTWICYLNAIKNNGVELCFLEAKKINHYAILKFNGRKMIGGIAIYDTKKIPFTEIDNIMKEAIEIDHNKQIKNNNITKKQSI